MTKNEEPLPTTSASETAAGSPAAESAAYSARELDLIERLKNAEAKASFLSELDRTVQPIAEPAEVMATTARMLAERLGAARCAYAEVEDQSIFVITGDFTRDVPSIVGSWPVAAFGRECERQMLANEAYIVTDTDTDERIGPEDIPAYRATTIRAVICVPLHKDGRFTAAMAVHQTQPRAWTAAEIDLVKTTVNRCWESLERARAARVLRESEQRLRTMADSIPQLAFMTEPDGGVFWYNQQWRKYTGVTADEMEGWGWQAVHHPDVLPQVIERWSEAIKSGEPFSMEFPIRSANGSFRWFLCRINPLRNASGEIVRWFGTATDIQDRREVEDTLRQNQMLLSLAIQSSRMGVWERDVLAGKVWWSEELESIFGLEKGSFPGTEEFYYGLIFEEDRELARTAVRSAIEERRDYSFEFRFYHASGEIRWMEGRGRAVYSENGDPIKLYGTGIDVTDRKKSEEKNRFLAELDRAVQQIAEPDEVMAVTAQMLADHLGADRCAYAEIEDDGRTFAITGDYTRGVPSIVGRWPIESFGSEFARLMRANEPYLVVDTDTDPRISADDLPAYRATTIRSVIAVPLYKDSIFTAGMAVHQQVPRAWTPDEVELVKLVVGRCWESIERTRAARAVRLSDERFRLALSSGAVTVYEQDTELRYKWVFPTTPYRPDVIGKTDQELSPGVGADLRTELKRRVLETGKSLREEVPAMIAGVEHWYDLLVEPRRDETGNIIGVGGTALDITERKRLEASFLESEERFRALMEQAPLSIQLLDMSGRTLSVNRAFEELWGLTLDQLADYNILEDPQLQPTGVAAGLRRAFAGEALELPEIPYDPNETLPGLSSNTDTLKWTSGVAYPLKGPNGELREVALVHRDITEKKRAEDKLEQQKTLLESLTESVLDGILIVSPTGEMLHFNQQFLNIWDFPAEVLRVRSDEAALTWAAEQTADPEAFLQRVSHIYNQPDAQFREEMAMKDGRVYERFGAPIRHGETRLGWVWTFRDITERKRLVEALERHGEQLEATVQQRTRELRETNKGLKIENKRRQQLEAERLKLLAAITTVQEDERRRIALDLHDHLGQQLTALKFRIEILRLRGFGSDEFEKLIAEANELVSRIDEEVDAISWGLRPPSLDDIGLMESLADYINEWSRRFQIPVKIRTARFGKKRLPPESETHLYRITQEILTNICKHAKATSVDITLERRQDRAILTVLDDGVGFVPTKRKSTGGNGMGLIGMRERAAIMGGTMTVESEPGKGTIVTVNVPVSGPQKQ